jgi:hypothetical protein
MTTPRGGSGGCGTQTSALAFGGGSPAITTTEEWTGTVDSTKTVTVS